MNKQEDKLFKLIPQRDNLATVISDSAVPREGKWEIVASIAADDILAAGYRRPRTITTAEELDALAEGSAVLTNTVWLRVHSNHGFLVWGCVGSHGIYRSNDVSLPATVLHYGGAA